MYKNSNQSQSNSMRKHSKLERETIWKDVGKMIYHAILFAFVAEVCHAAVPRQYYDPDCVRENPFWGKYRQLAAAQVANGEFPDYHVSKHALQIAGCPLGKLVACMSSEQLSMRSCLQHIPVDFYLMVSSKWPVLALLDMTQTKRLRAKRMELVNNVNDARTAGLSEAEEEEEKGDSSARMMSLDTISTNLAGIHQEDGMIENTVADDCASSNESPMEWNHFRENVFGAVSQGKEWLLRKNTQSPRTDVYRGIAMGESILQESSTMPGECRFGHIAANAMQVLGNLLHEEDSDRRLERGFLELEKIWGWKFDILDSKWRIFGLVHIIQEQKKFILDLPEAALTNDLTKAPSHLMSKNPWDWSVDDLSHCRAGWDSDEGDETCSDVENFHSYYIISPEGKMIKQTNSKRGIIPDQDSIVINPVNLQEDRTISLDKFHQEESHLNEQAGKTKFDDPPENKKEFDDSPAPGKKAAPPSNGASNHADGNADHDESEFFEGNGEGSASSSSSSTKEKTSSTSSTTETSSKTTTPEQIEQKRVEAIVVPPAPTRPKAVLAKRVLLDRKKKTKNQENNEILWRILKLARQNRLILTSMNPNLEESFRYWLRRARYYIVQAGIGVILQDSYKQGITCTSVASKQLSSLDHMMEKHMCLPELSQGNFFISVLGYMRIAALAGMDVAYVSMEYLWLKNPAPYLWVQDINVRSEFFGQLGGNQKRLSNDVFSVKASTAGLQFIENMLSHIYFFPFTIFSKAFERIVFGPSLGVLSFAEEGNLQFHLPNVHFYDVEGTFASSDGWFGRQRDIVLFKLAPISDFGWNLGMKILDLPKVSENSAMKNNPVGAASITSGRGHGTTTHARSNKKKQKDKKKDVEDAEGVATTHSGTVKRLKRKKKNKSALVGSVSSVGSVPLGFSKVLSPAALKEYDHSCELFYGGGPLLPNHPILFTRTSVSAKRPLWQLYIAAPSFPGNVTHNDPGTDIDGIRSISIRSKNESGSGILWTSHPNLKLTGDNVVGVRDKIHNIDNAKNLCEGLSGFCAGITCSMKNQREANHCYLREGKPLYSLDTVAVAAKTTSTTSKVNQKRSSKNPMPTSEEKILDDYQSYFESRAWTSKSRGGTSKPWVQYLTSASEKNIVSFTPATQQFLSDETLLHCTYAASTNQEGVAKKSADSATRKGGVSRTVAKAISNLSDAFKSRNKQLLESGQITGKAYIFLQSLLEMEDSEILIMTDTNVRFVKDARPLVASLLKGSDVAGSLTEKAESALSSRNAFQLLNMDFEVVARAPQVSTSVIIARKSPLSLKFAHDWLRASEDARLVSNMNTVTKLRRSTDLTYLENMAGIRQTDLIQQHMRDEFRDPKEEKKQNRGKEERKLAKSVIRNYPDFEHHSGEQSVFSLLFKKFGFHAFNEEQGNEYFGS